MGPCPPQRPAGDVQRYAPAIEVRGPGGQVRPASAPTCTAWCSVVSWCLGGPPGLQAAQEAAPHWAGPRRRPGRRHRLSPSPPPLRAVALPTPAPRRQRRAGRCEAALVVGPGLRWVWPARWGARSVLPASARVRPLCALLGWVPLPDALVGRPPKRMGRRRPSCGGNGGGDGSGPKVGPLRRQGRPPAVSPSWGYRPIPCSSWPYGWPSENRRKVSNLAILHQSV